MISLTMLTALAGLASAQSMSSMSMAPQMTATATAGQPLVVNVGSSSGDLVFEPDVVMAPPGSMLEFHFYPQNHSVVQGMFDSACMPMPNGFYSGFIPSMMGEAPETFTVNVADSNPIWVYCSQGEHCQAGMAMVVNPDMSNMDQQLPQYLSAAAAASTNVSPATVTGGTVGTMMGSATPTPTPSMSGMSSMSGSSMMSSMGAMSSMDTSATMSAAGGMASETASPPPTGAAPMLGEGIAWGVAGAAGVVGAFLL